MSYVFEEIPDSRRITYDPPTLTLRYKCAGLFDDGEVWAAALGGTAQFVATVAGVLYRQDLRIEERGHRQYEVEVPYAQKKKENGSYSVSFDTSGATVKVKVAREHVASYPLDDPAGANPHKGAIGVKPDGDVDGCDVIIPALKLDVRFKHPQGVVTMAQIKTLARVTGTTNAVAFLTFDRGELLLLGASGSEGTDVETEVGYSFLASEQAWGLTFGDITGIDKGGHHYAWVEFEDTTENDRAAVQPKRVHIERVYEETDFATVLGFG